MNLAMGPTVLDQFYYRGANAALFFLLATEGFYYPFVLSAFGVQLLVWMEHIFAVKSLKNTGASWAPRLKWLFFFSSCSCFAFQLAYTVLLLLNVDAPLAVLLYRVSLFVFLLMLLCVGLAGGIRLMILLRRATKTDSKATANRKSITRTMFVTCFVLFAVLMCNLLAAFLPWETDLSSFYPYSFVVRSLENAAFFFVLLAFSYMMKNRIYYVQQDSDSTFVQRKKTTSKRRSTVSSELNEPLIEMETPEEGSVLDSDIEEAMNNLETLGSMPPAMSTRQRNTASSLLETSIPDGQSYSFQVGDLMWAQYRLDGLWYAAKVLSLLPNSELEIEYIDYKLTDDQLPISATCPDYHNILSKENRTIKAFDSRPLGEVLSDGRDLAPDTFGLVRLRGKISKKPNHTSLLLKRGSLPN